MFGVGEYPPQPAALKAMLGLLKLKVPTVQSYPEVPSTYPTQFIVVDKTGGTETADGKISNPVFVIQCYANDVGSAETLAGLVVSVLKSAQFTKHGTVQFRKLTVVSEPTPYNNPVVPNRKRWQTTVQFSMSAA